MRFFITSIIICLTANSFAQNKRNTHAQRDGFWRVAGADRPDSAYAYCDTCTIETGFYKSARKNGEWRTYYPDRTLKSLTEYKNGKINGKVLKYYETGCPQETGIWVSTAIRDTLKYYAGGKDSCGTIVKRVWYNNNQRIEDRTLITPKIKPDPNKKLTGEEVMSDQVVKDGYQKVYDSKRRILMDGTFKDGKLQSGKWYRYDGKGALTRIEIWNDGKYVEDAPLENIPGHNE